jgi:hypothetical protein
MSYQQENFTAIADKIRERTNTTDLIIPKDFPSKIDDVYRAGYTDGSNAGYSIGWEVGTTDGYNSGYSALEKELLGGAW